MKKKFGQDDLFVNSVETYPKQNFLIRDRQVYYQRSGLDSSSVPPGYIDLYGLNPGREAAGFDLIYPFKYKDSSLDSLSSVTVSGYRSAQWGDVLTGSYPVSASISRDWFSYNSSSGDEVPSRMRALKRAYSSYAPLSPLFNESLDDIGDVALVGIPSIFYGSKLRRGSVILRFFVTGNLFSEVSDVRRDGVLVETTGSSVGRSVGTVMYSHGFILLTGSWQIEPGAGPHVEAYYPTSSALVPATWRFWGTTGSATPNTNAPSSSFELEFEGTSLMQTYTMFAHAGIGEYNHSNNPTYIAKDPSASVIMTGSSHFREFRRREIKNIVTSSYPDTTGSFEKTTYITSIGIYDDQGDLIGVAKTASPVRKRMRDAYTFKLKLDV